MTIEMRYYLRIGEVSKITGLTCSTLRYYQQINLIRDIKKDEAGLRIYSAEDVQWINFIVSVKTANLSIQDINLYADLYYSKNENFRDRLNLTLECKEKLVKEREKMNQGIEFMNEKIEYYKTKIAKTNDNIK